MVDASCAAPSRTAGTINKKQLTPLAARLSTILPGPILWSVSIFLGAKLNSASVGGGAVLIHLAPLMSLPALGTALNLVKVDLIFRF
jgi:hypothetical protein